MNQDYISEMIKKRGITVEALAEALCVEKQTVRSLKNGWRRWQKIKTEGLLALADLLEEDHLAFCGLALGIMSPEEFEEYKAYIETGVIAPIKKRA